MAVGAPAYRAVCADVSGGHEVVVAMQALRVELTERLAYWTVVDEQWRPVPLADSFLRHLRLGADRPEDTTRTYAGDLACYLEWCTVTGRDLPAGARQDARRPTGSADRRYPHTEGSTSAIAASSRHSRTTPPSVRVHRHSGR